MEIADPSLIYFQVKVWTAGITLKFIYFFKLLISVFKKYLTFLQIYNQKNLEKCYKRNINLNLLNFIKLTMKKRLKNSKQNMIQTCNKKLVRKNIIYKTLNN